jgi:two-component system, NarL family, sensor kinase
MYYIRNIAVLLSALLVGFFSTANAQYNNWEEFEKKKTLAVAELKSYPRPDTARVNALIKVFSTAIFLREREAVMQYRAEALDLSRRLGYVRGMAAAYASYGLYYKSRLEPALSHTYFDSVLYIIGNSQEPRHIRQKAFALERKGTLFFEQDSYYQALDYFFESMKYTGFQPVNNKSNLYTNITQVYIRLNNLEKAEEYAKLNVALIESDTADHMNMSVYFSLVDIYLIKQNLDRAEFYNEKVGRVVPHPYEVQINYGYYLKKGHINYQREKFREAFDDYRQAYGYALKGGHKNSISASLRALSNTALKLNNSEAAKSYAMQNLALAEEINTKTARMEALMNLSNYYNKTGNTQKAYDLLEQAMIIKDSLLSETNIKQVNVLAAIYESEKQQKEILVLQNEKEMQAESVKQKNTLNIVFIASILILLFLGYLGYTNFKKGQQIARDQQELQLQKIIELEKDKQLITVDAMLKGQEEERSRIAKDLHDGLGSLLSGTKLSFMNVRENVMMTAESNALFDKSLSMLDNTIGDLRKVAQNLMPEALVKFGLHEALRDFCNSIQSSTDVKVVYQQFGEKRKLNNTAEVFIYRIVQELVANIIRHAEASEIMVQLMMNENATELTVEDNGKGFDKSVLQYKKGAGIRNITYRVQYLNGTLDIDTTPGNGTSVNIQLPI